MYYTKKQGRPAELPRAQISTEKIKCSRQKLNTISPISKVDTRGFLGIGTHKVTGAELNKTITEFELQLSGLKRTSCDIIDNLEGISAFIAELDREYLAGLSDSAMIADNAAKAAQQACEESERNMAQIRILVEKIREFRQRLTDIQHLYDVDQLWLDQTAQQDSLLQLKTELHEYVEQLNQLKDLLTYNQTQGLEHQVLTEMSRKLRTAYILAASSAGIVVVHIVLNLVGIL